MIREIVTIDESLCNGCGACIPKCHEGALKVIDGKAKLISSSMCDGLGACLGHCPHNAIKLEYTESYSYDEEQVLDGIIPQGKSAVTAHLEHLKHQNEIDLLQQAIQILKDKYADQIDLADLCSRFNSGITNEVKRESCPGTKSRILNSGLTQSGHLQGIQMAQKNLSALTHWPIQLHLINPDASCFNRADLLVAADCTAFACGQFHNQFLKGKKLVIACPKLDEGKSIYLEKLIRLINDAKIKSITVLRMEVPCCSGLTNLVKKAIKNSSIEFSYKEIILTVQGELMTF